MNQTGLASSSARLFRSVNQFMYATAMMRDIGMKPHAPLKNNALIRFNRLTSLERRHLIVDSNKKSPKMPFLSTPNSYG